MRDLMYHVKDKLDFGIAMSPTEESSESLGTFLPSSWIYNDFNQGAVEKMMALQRSTGSGPRKQRVPPARRLYV